MCVFMELRPESAADTRTLQVSASVLLIFSPTHLFFLRSKPTTGVASSGFRMSRFHSEHRTHRGVFGARETYDLLTQAFYLHCDKLSQSGFATVSESHQEMTNGQEGSQNKPSGQLEQVVLSLLQPYTIIIYVISHLNRHS